MLILSATSVEGGDRIAVLLIDVEDALGRVHARRSKPNPPSPEDLAAIEEEISRYSVLARPPIEDGVTSTEQLKDYVQRLIEQQLRDALVAAGHWRPFGSIQVDVGVSDPFAIELDGVSLGATVDGKATLLDVRPGERRIVLENEDFEELATSAKVETGKIAGVRVTPIKKPSQAIFVIRQAVLWGGVASTAAGISLMIYGLVRPFERRAYCFHSEGTGSACDSDPFVRFGGSEDDIDSTSNGGGAPILPLGYSLLGLGTAWMLGPLIDGDPDRIPWIEAVVGLVVFGAAFGLSLGLDHQDPFCKYDESC